MAGAALAMRRVADEHEHEASRTEGSLEGEISKDDMQAGAPDNLPFHSWDCERVVMWFRERGDLPDSLLSSVEAMGIDGAAVMELSAEAWEELGLSSRVAQAKLVSAIKRVGSYRAATGASDSSVWGGGGYRKAGEAELLALIRKRTPEGGAEHTKWWLAAIVNSNLDPGNTKSHILRFLGMYNVVDLLAFTIAISYVMNADPATSWYTLPIHFMLILSAFMTGIALLASSVLYNTTSSVSEINIPLFAKQPCTIRQMQLVNDYSIFGFVLMIITHIIIILALGLGEYLPLEVDTSETDLSKASTEYVVFFWVRVVFVFAIPFFFLVWRHLNGLVTQPYSMMLNIALTTHASMYGGLMGDKEVLPPGEETGWAIRATVEECGAFCCGRIMDTIKNPSGFQDALLEYYAAETAARMRVPLAQEVFPPHSARAHRTSSGGGALL